jgi:NADH:ubiquinone oxidoreductase subunit F (NADH-binding)
MTAVRLFAGTRVGAPLSLSEHRAVHGPPGSGGPALAAAAEAAGLRGRGGAAFPTAVKLRSDSLRRRPCTVLVNAAEGEPMSAKDRWLLRLAPHLVLDGALAAAETVGAERVVVAIPADAADTRRALQRALEERATALPIEIAAVPVAYLAGEESALIAHLDGGPLKPTVAPPLPTQRGLRGRPTLVQNPETLAHLALIARHGADWFRAVGTHASPGTALVTVCGAIARPSVLEIAYGTPLSAVLAVAGGPAEPLRAVLVGGYHGTWLAADSVGTVTLDDAGLAPYQARLGAGVLVGLGASACGVREVARVLTWMAGQSARQCGPCRNGLPALAGMVTAIADGRAPRDGRARLDLWSVDVTGRGACRLPDGAARFLQSSMRIFADEFADHARHGPCGACRRAGTLLVPEPMRRAA